MCLSVSVDERKKEEVGFVTILLASLFVFFEVAMMNMLCERQPTTACDFFLYDFL